ncbi:MAG: aldehyde dehydrogenase family protein [Candidatus Woesearchaeota archaeon]
MMVRGNSVNKSLKGVQSTLFAQQTPPVSHKNSHLIDKQMKRFLSHFKGFWIQRKRSIIQEAVKCTRTPIKYHIQDYYYVLRFIGNLPKEIKYRKSKNLRLVPKGKVLLALSSNEPIIMSTIPIIYSLLAGNQVYVSPSSQNYSIVKMILSIMIKAGVNKGQMSILKIKKKKISQTLKNLDINCVFWFGSSNVISKVSQEIPMPFVEFIPEAEGNDLCYVDERVNYPQVAKIIINSLVTHNGQVCNAIKGVLVHKNSWRTIVNEIVQKFDSIRMGPCFDINTDCSGDTSLNAFLVEKKRQIAGPRTKVLSKSNNMPFIIVNPKMNRTCLEMSSFGSLIWVHKVNSISEANRLIARSRHGLGFTVFSDDPQSLKLIKSDAGRISVNEDPLEVSPFSPWGGLKLSGNSGPDFWLEKFSNRQYITGGI